MQYITLQNGWLPSTDGPFIGGKRIRFDLLLYIEDFDWIGLNVPRGTLGRTF